MEKEVILIIIFIILILFICVVFFDQKYIKNSDSVAIIQGPNNKIIDSKEIILPENIDRNYYPPEQVPSGKFMSYDPIRTYDYNKIYDILEAPVRRDERDQIPAPYLRRMLDIPTRGYPDNFKQIGVLVKDDTDCCNKIMKLFGRAEFPGSSRYEYYTLVSSGNDVIKIPIYNKNGNELYDGDHIYIKSLNAKYKVELFSYDQPTYLPDVLD